MTITNSPLVAQPIKKQDLYQSTSRVILIFNQFNFTCRSLSYIRSNLDFLSSHSNYAKVDHTFEERSVNALLQFLSTTSVLITCLLLGCPKRPSLHLGHSARRSQRGTRKLGMIIAHCRNARALGRVSYIDLIINLNFSTKMAMNEKVLN